MDVLKLLGKDESYYPSVRDWIIKNPLSIKGGFSIEVISPIKMTNDYEDNLVAKASINTNPINGGTYVELKIIPKNPNMRNEFRYYAIYYVNKKFYISPLGEYQARWIDTTGEIYDYTPGQFHIRIKLHKSIEDIRIPNNDKEVFTKFIKSKREGKLPLVLPIKIRRKISTHYDRTGASLGTNSEYLVRFK